MLLTRTAATVGLDQALSAALAPWRRPLTRHDRARSCRPVEYLELAGEGHDFRRADSRRRLIETVVRFLAGALAVASEKPVDDAMTTS